MNKPIRVVLIEDNPEFAEVIKLALADEPDMELQDHFGTSEIAIRTLEKSAHDDPDLILLDIRLPGMDGLSAIPAIRSSIPNIKIIILTQSNQEDEVLRAIASGASGYLLKSATLADLTHGIRTVMAGGATLDSSVAKFILNTLQTKLPQDHQEQLLSDRELDVLSLLAEGLSKKEIAKRLEISYTTVDTHVGRVYAKLDVNSGPAAVDRAHRLKLLPPE